jgi:hypothetical protein
MYSLVYMLNDTAFTVVKKIVYLCTFHKVKSSNALYCISYELLACYWHWFGPLFIPITSSHDWLIIYSFTSRSRIFHLYGDVTIAGEGLRNLGLCTALRTFEEGGIFIVPHMLWHVTSVFPVLSEGPPHSVASYDTHGDVEDLFQPGYSRGTSSQNWTNGRCESWKRNVYPCYAKSEGETGLTAANAYCS